MLCNSENCQLYLEDHDRPMLPYPIADSQSIEILYPLHTSVSHIHEPRFIERRIHVLSSRDLVKEPLTINEFRRRPFLNRSRWLLKAWDVDVQGFRQFYLGSSAQYRAPGTLQVVVFDPEISRPKSLVSRQYEPTLSDRRELMKVLCTIERQRRLDLNELRIIAPDMRLV